MSIKIIAAIFQFLIVILFVVQNNVDCSLKDIVISIFVVGGFICLCL